MTANTHRLYGQPPYTVAVVHGGPGAPGSMAAVARELSGEFGVLEPLQTLPTVAGQLDELAEAIRRHAQPPVVVVGSSWGAMLGFVLAARCPAIVRKLILVGSGVFEEAFAADIMAVRLGRLGASDRSEAERLAAALDDEAITDKNSVFAQLGELVTKADCFDPLLPVAGTAGPGTLFRDLGA